MTRTEADLVGHLYAAPPLLPPLWAALMWLRRTVALGHLNPRAQVLIGPSQSGGLSPLASDWFRQKHVVHFWPMRHEETSAGGF